MRSGILAFSGLLIGGLPLGSAQQLPPNQPPPARPALGRPVSPPAAAPGTPLPTAAAPAVVAEPDASIRFDPQKVDVRHLEGRWLLVAGDVWLKDFGRDEMTARKARLLLRNLELNEMAFLGRPRPAFEYFLASGKAPTGPVGGLQVFKFDPAKVELKQHFNEWRLVFNQQALFRFGTNRAEAERALALVQHYRFNQVAYLGQPEWVMALLLCSSTGDLQPKPLEGTSLGGRSPKPAFTETPGGKPLPPAGLSNRNPDLAELATRVPFDYRQALLRKANNNWQIMIGAYPLKEFGPNEQAAREALRAIQFYRFTEQHLLGEGENRFEYYLAQGQAPRGQLVGQDRVPFHPDYLSLKQLDGVWWISQFDKSLFRFAERADAQRVLDLLKKYRFDQVCTIGKPPLQMKYLVKTR